MNLLFIFTGGTIGSTLSGDYITTDENKPYELLEAYRNKYGFEHTYNVMTPYTELSEQNTGETISKLIRCVCDAVGGRPADVDNDKGQAGLEDCLDGNKEDEDDCRNRMGEVGKCCYDGIIVTHGTDTLPYSAAALSYALGNTCIPVCLVSSNYPIADDKANGVDNLHGAIRLMEDAVSHSEADASTEIENGINDIDTMSTGERKQDDKGMRHRGVFVSYRNHDGIIYIHRASRLLETAAFSDKYYSIRDEYYGRIVDNSFQKNEAYKESDDKQDPIGEVVLADICDRIARYHVYPGIQIKADDRTECILLEGYHSGTLNTRLTEYQSFYERMHELRVPVYLTGIRKGISYESTSLYQKLHIQPLYDIAPVAAYIKLWMLISAGRQWDSDILNLPLGGDM
ncbi:MAG: asparaginase [Lachnospiraceae bacterium]|nr:asparaginase [Lachnospiraceae bacterium]